MERIKTRFAANVDAARALPEYPRPQLVREGWMNLNGLYDYAVTPRGAQQPERFEGQILVPFCIESALSGVERALKPDELLWYRRTFELSEAFYGKKVILHFGAVDWQCKVWVNGKLVGTHTGGYCPFSFEITGYINAHNNELIVCVYDPTDEGWQQRGKQVLKTHGFWYTATSGIWQTVWLEAVDKCYIREAKAVPDIDRGLFTLNIINHRLVRRRGEQALAPIALIEQAALEVGPVVEHQARQALFIAADAAFAHAHIGAHGVVQPAPGGKLQLEII